jgi:hypothetical protein
MHNNNNNNHASISNMQKLIIEEGFLWKGFSTVLKIYLKIALFVLKNKVTNNSNIRREA